jgi:hypothetical protein
MSAIKIITEKWAQFLVLTGITSILGGAAWIAFDSITFGTTPMAPLLLLTLGMMPSMVGLEELANRRKTLRQAFNRR